MRRDYNDPIYKEFRNKVLKRDKFKCRMCKNKNKLNVHHLMKWSSASTLRYDTDNGITLCEDCHRSICGKETYYAEYFRQLIINGEKKCEKKTSMKKKSGKKKS